MTRISMKTIREMSPADLTDKIREAKGELGKLRTDDAKGTLRKESGKIRAVRKDIARMMTGLNEAKRGKGA